MRLLLTADAVGGVWTYAVDLAHGLAGLGIQTVLAAMGPLPSPAQRLAAQNVPGLRLLDTRLPLDWLAEDADAIAAAGAALVRIAAQERVDIVQLNTPALAAEAAFDRPVVSVLHSCVATWWDQVQGGAPLPGDFGWRTDLVRAGLEASDLVVTPTASFGAMAQRVYGLSSPPSTVYNGRAPIAVGASAPHDFVFTAGRLWDAGKNLASLDAAAGGIAVPVHAAGPLSGPQGETVAFAHLNPLGSLDPAELARWLAAKPVYAAPALYEPFGLSVLEAAQVGCSLVLADIPTFRELWEDIAVFVDPRDPLAWARACNELVGDDFERAVIGRAAQERAAHFTPETMAAQMASLYRGLLPEVRKPVLAARAAA